MKVLIDYCVDARFATHISGHEVRTTAELRWEHIKNGKLLEAAIAAGFEVFVTVDRNLQHQQNVRALPIVVIVIATVTNRLADLLPAASLVEAALKSPKPGTVVEIVAPKATKR